MTTTTNPTNAPPSKTTTVASWTLRILAAGIMGQTLFFKFTGAPEAIHITTTLGVEPWGRFGIGIAELIAIVLLIVPRTKIFGAFASLSLMIGAIGAHLGPLGIVVQDDGGLLFALAVTVALASIGILTIHREQVLQLARFPFDRSLAIT